MAIVIGKLLKKTYESPEQDYHVYWFRSHGGKCNNAVFHGKDAPKPRKTVEMVLMGVWRTHPKFGKQFIINEFKRSDIKNKNIDRETLNNALKKIG